jgi:hypothetical protein
MTSQIRGRILYTSRKPERLGHERGREWFSVVTDARGWRTLQVQCEIDDAPPVLRHVTQTVDEHWRPVDAHVRVAVDRRELGSTWFRFGETSAECEGFTANEGRISQVLPLAHPPTGFISHPIQGDAWLCAAYPLSAGPGRRTMRHLASSLDHRGASGPMLCRDFTDWTFHGTERIEVAAGRFDALHFSLGGEGNWSPEDVSHHPPYHMWVTADGEYVFLRAYVEGYMMTHYELQELERR